MFQRIEGTSALLVLCILNVAGKCQSMPSRLLPHGANEFDGCEDMAEFLYTLKSMTPYEALSTITLPLTSKSNPPQIQKVRQKLLIAVTNGSLTINHILKELARIRNRNRYDLLITTLMAINEYYETTCGLKRDISKAIFYLLKQKYLFKNEFNIEEKFGTCNKVKYSQICQRRKSLNLNKNLNFKLFDDQRKEHIFVENRANVFRSPNLMETFQNQRQYSPVIDFSLNPRRKKVPVPLAYSTTQHATVRAGVSSPSKLTSKIIPTLPSNVKTNAMLYGTSQAVVQNQDSCACQRAMFEAVLKKLTALENKSLLLSPRALPIPANPSNTTVKPVATTTAPKSVVSTVQPRTTVNIDDLIKLLPQPKSDKEKEMLVKFKKLLGSSQIQKLIKNLNLSKYHDNYEILDVIITTVLESVIITDEIYEIFSFFVPYKEMKKSNFNYGNLITALPGPKNEKEKGYYDILKKFLTSVNVYNSVSSQELINEPDTVHQLLLLMKKLITSKITPQEVLQAINYYLPVIAGRLSKIHFDELVSLLPRPTTKEDTVNFNTFRNFLESNEIYWLMQNISLVHVTTKDELLKLVLRQQILNPLSTLLSLIATYYRTLLAIQQFGFNYFDLLTLIQPTDENVQSLRVIQDYMYTLEFESILKLLNLTSLSDSDKLILILQSIQTKSTHKQVADATAFILQKIYERNFYRHMDKLISFFPQPKNDDENNKYEKLTRFLHTSHAYSILKNLDLSLFLDKSFIEVILKTLAESQLPVEVKEAVMYYLSLSYKLETLEFVTRKEIKKNFKLHEIFSDTLNLQQLTIQQKNALKKIFKYLSNAKPSPMSRFDSWDEAKTRGQFVKLLFKYLLEVNTTPSEIKTDIQLLNPAVSMDGKAALPP